MPLTNFAKGLEAGLSELQKTGTSKGKEQVVTGVRKAEGDLGPRYFLDGYGDQAFLRMNANSYLGMSLRQEVIEAEETAAVKYGVGPGAVRFISGTFEPHVDLERALATFHNREDCMITSSAYTSVLGVISTLATSETIILSDELNHNCIINAMKLARPKGKKVFQHLDMAALASAISELVGTCENLIVVTDGIFSMRGDYAPLNQMCDIISKYNDRFPKDIILVVDDSHGVGALGKTGRGTEEFTEAGGVDILVATLGKAFGVNGGYIVSDHSVIQFLREKNPFYIYTNPITPSEATASLKAIETLESDTGQQLLEHLREMTARFERGLIDLGFETIPSEHPVVPLLVRDTQKTTEMVEFLRSNGVLATGLNYPVVPKGDQLIRFQVSADHTPNDIDYALEVLRSYKNR
jgi:glycine C-acetyltransferase